MKLEERIKKSERILGFVPFLMPKPNGKYESYASSGCNEYVCTCLHFDEHHVKKSKQCIVEKCKCKRFRAICHN